MTPTVRVAAVQASATQFWTEEKFQERILDLTRDAVQRGAQIVVFPEDIDFWLAFVKESPLITRERERAGGIPISQMTARPTESKWRLALERAADWCFSRTYLAWLGHLLVNTKVERVIARAFSLAASTYSVVIVAGSYYRKDSNGCHAVSRVYDRDGSEAGMVEKLRVIPVEHLLGAVGSTMPSVISTRDYKIGVAICYDINSPDVCAHLATEGAQVLCVPTTGIRPWPGYPFDPAVDMPQVQRAQETGLAVIRAYQCGWLFPGIYFDGHASIVMPDGSVAARSVSPRHEEIVVADIPLK